MLGRVLAIQELTRHEPQHRVAEELQPFVRIARALPRHAQIRAVRERQLEQLGVLEVDVVVLGEFRRDARFLLGQGTPRDAASGGGRRTRFCGAPNSRLIQFHSDAGSAAAAEEVHCAHGRVLRGGGVEVSARGCHDQRYVVAPEPERVREGGPHLRGAGVIRYEV